VNPHVEVIGHDARLTSENALEIIRGYDLVVDGTDNFATRYLTNDACVLLGKPNVYGSIFRFEARRRSSARPTAPATAASTRSRPRPGLVPSCAEGGVLGILPGLVGVIQATETVKYIAGLGESLAGRTAPRRPPWPCSSGR